MNENKNIKYTIGAVQQSKALEYDLDLKDAFILTYLKELTSKKLIQKVIDNNTYFWIDYDALIDYMPLLGISTSKVLGRRFAKYEELGFIKRHLHKSYSKAKGQFSGSWTFIMFEEKFNELFEIGNIANDTTKMNEILEEMGLPTEDTQKFSLESPRELESSFIRGNSKVQSVNHEEVNNNGASQEFTEGTQKWSVNSPNPINNTPIKADEIFLDKNQKEQLELIRIKVIKNIFVAKAIKKSFDNSENFVNKIVIPALKKNSFEIVCKAFKNLYNCTPHEITTIAGIFYKNLLILKSA
ncbi:hypothetical protein [Cetobacterium sp.]|uniref:hypothetical protein n=1 Tax=Cetobacterium sp. TaxID=2071632 RepID=UPI0025C5ED6E|nr:hypothetical protein [Cetobacterium sp.]